MIHLPMTTGSSLRFPPCFEEILMYSHRIKNAIQFGVDAAAHFEDGYVSESKVKELAIWLDAHPNDGTFAQYVEEQA